jgi:hypothetical protein
MPEMTNNGSSHSCIQPVVRTWQCGTPFGPSPKATFSSLLRRWCSKRLFLHLQRRPANTTLSCLTQVLSVSVTAVWREGSAGPETRRPCRLIGCPNVGLAHVCMMYGVWTQCRRGEETANCQAGSRAPQSSTRRGRH